ncbi:MAG: pilin [Candidatus Azambacteria bacterium]|nr:pilin [Candidatus Azambacteria bacterium]
MKKAFLIFFLIVFLGSLLFPLVSLALNNYQADGKTINYEGLIPCGKSKDKPLEPGESEEVRNPCQFCHFFVMFKAILDFALKLVIMIAVLMFVYGGFLYLTGGSNPGQMQTAKEVLRSTVIGLIIIFAAWVIINTVFIFFGLSSFGLSLTGPGKWFIINCPITL